MHAKNDFMHNRHKHPLLTGNNEYVYAADHSLGMRL